jgi:putative hydrolase of the HAD superfamily
VTPPIQAIVSDFGGVLTNPLFEGFARVQEEFGVPLDVLGAAMQDIADREGENPLFPLERGEVTEATFLERLGMAVSRRLHREVHLAGFSAIYFAGLRANDELIAWLRAAREERGLRLALLTNNVREWEPRWRSMLPIDELFEVVVDSAFVGMRKPDRRIYDLTLDRLGLPASACAFLDDLEPNIDAATSLGLRAVRFRDTAQAIADLEALLDERPATP